MNKTLITIAKACGIKEVKPNCWVGKGINQYTDYQLEQYFNSLDSMQSAVLMQDEEFQRVFAEKLYAKALLTKDRVWLLNTPYPVRLPLFHQLTVLDWQQAFVETWKQLGRV